MAASTHPRHRTPQVGDRVRLRRHTTPRAIRDGMAEVIELSRTRPGEYVTVTLDPVPGDNGVSRWRRWSVDDVVVVKVAADEASP